ncbi:GATA zinc finger domain-containing protein 14-like isoform X5 [Leptopilina boulardi]|uniref:GATA zinc finger domain-containing protein 14-like isoform X5 n=1 Tax=Leptopilina boulardi TaxID=63433 RepID=UPI0021F5C0D5|nr:GATA zinc finger domain-containing protein 14-like isoform X5 [Leptopilina boulardi]
MGLSFAKLKRKQFHSYCYCHQKLIWLFIIQNVKIYCKLKVTCFSTIQVLVSSCSFGFGCKMSGIVEVILNDCLQEAEYNDDKIYYLKGKKKGSVKCIFKKKLYYVSPDNENILYCGYRKDPCYAKIIKCDESFEEEGEHTCKDLPNRDIDHIGIEQAESSIMRLCKESDLSYKKIIEIVQERCPTLKITYDGFKRRMTSWRSSVRLNHVVVGDFLNDLNDSDFSKGKIVDDDDIAVIIQTDSLTEHVESTTVLYIDEFYKMTFRKFDITIMTLSIEISKKACVAFYAICSNLTSSLRQMILSQINQFDCFKNIELIIGPYCSEIVNDVTSVFDVEYAGSWCQFIQVLVQKWIVLDIGPVSEHILYYFATLPVIPKHEYINAAIETKDLVSSNLTTNTQKFVDETFQNIILGSKFVPLFEGRSERSNDVIDIINQLIKTKLLNSKTSGEFIETQKSGCQETEKITKSKDSDKNKTQIVNRDNSFEFEVDSSLSQSLKETRQSVCQETEMTTKYNNSNEDNNQANRNNNFELEIDLSLSPALKETQDSRCQEADVINNCKGCEENNIQIFNINSFESDSSFSLTLEDIPDSETGREKLLTNESKQQTTVETLSHAATQLFSPTTSVLKLSKNLLQPTKSTIQKTSLSFLPQTSPEDCDEVNNKLLSTTSNLLPSPRLSVLPSSENSHHSTESTTQTTRLSGSPQNLSEGSHEINKQPNSESPAHASNQLSSLTSNVLKLSKNLLQPTKSTIQKTSLSFLPQTSPEDCDEVNNKLLSTTSNLLPSPRLSVLTSSENSHHSTESTTQTTRLSGSPQNLSEGSHEINKQPNSESPAHASNQLSSLTSNVLKLSKNLLQPTKSTIQKTSLSFLPQTSPEDCDEVNNKLLSTTSNLLPSPGLSVLSSSENSHHSTESTTQTTRLSGSPQNLSKGSHEINKQPNSESPAHASNQHLSSLFKSSKTSSKSLNLSATTIQSPSFRKLSTDLGTHFKSENTKDKRTIRSQMFKLVKKVNETNNYTRSLFYRSCLSDRIHLPNYSSLHSNRRFEPLPSTSNQSQFSRHLPNRFRSKTNLPHFSQSSRVSNFSPHSSKDSRTLHRSRSPRSSSNRSQNSRILPDTSQNLTRNSERHLQSSRMTSRPSHYPYSLSSRLENISRASGSSRNLTSNSERHLQSPRMTSRRSRSPYSLSSRLENISRASGSSRNLTSNSERHLQSPRMTSRRSRSPYSLSSRLENISRASGSNRNLTSNSERHLQSPRMTSRRSRSPYSLSSRLENISRVSRSSRNLTPNSERHLQSPRTSSDRSRSPRSSSSRINKR